MAGAASPDRLGRWRERCRVDHRRPRRVAGRAADVLRRDRARRRRRPREPARRRARHAPRPRRRHASRTSTSPGSGVETIAHLRENGRITLMSCAFNGQPAHLAASTARARVHELGSPGFDDARRRASRRCPGARSIIDVDGRPRHDVVRLRGAAHGSRRRPRPAARLGRARRATTGSSSTAAAKNATSIDGLPGLARVSSRVRVCAGARAHGRARRRRAAAVGRRRPAVPHRLRGDAARAAHDARAAARRRRAARRAAARGAARRRRSPTCSRSCRGTRPTIPIALVAELVGAGARRAAIGDHDVGPLRARPPARAAATPRSCARREVVGAAPDGEGRRRDRGAARAPRTRSTRSRPRCATRPFAGRTELDVHRELVERMLARGHERANFAIVAAGAHAASPHHEPSADRVIADGDIVLCDFGGTMQRLLLRHHAHVPRRRAAGRGARRVRGARRGAGSGRAGRDRRHAVRGGRRRGARA